MNVKHDMQGKNVLITGATSGIGKATAIALSAKGADLILPCRDVTKGDALRDELLSVNAHTRVSVLHLDLASLDSVRTLADLITSKEVKLDVLINNAGIMPMSYQQTDDGYEMQFGVNYLAHALLTLQLLDLLKAARQGRIIHVSSIMHRFGRIDLSTIHKPRIYFWPIAYGQSKLANVLFSNELARQLAATNVTSNAVHPGTVGTHIVREMPDWMLRVMHGFALTPEQGAAPSVDLACNPHYTNLTGAYMNKGTLGTASARSCDQRLAQALWAETLRLCDLPSGH